MIDQLKSASNVFTFLNEYFWFVSKRSIQDPVPLKQIVFLVKSICDVLRDLVPFVQYKKLENHLWRSVTFNKLQARACNFNKGNIPPWVFFTFLNWYQIVQSMSYIMYIKLRKSRETTS